jgi:molecular chaperone GrpE
MTDEKTPHDDPAVAAELKGVPEDMLEGAGTADGSAVDELNVLQEQLEAAQQDVLYARAEMQNVRRRLEKDITDARTYAATGFARDILSVSDNLGRALDSIPADLKEDERLKGFIAGIEATAREIDKVFGSHGISRIAAMGLPLDPNQHQAMLEVPSTDVEPGTVLQELQAGYMIKDRLLRPAMVAVAKKPD